MENNTNYFMHMNFNLIGETSTKAIVVYIINKYCASKIECLKYLRPSVFLPKEQMWIWEKASKTKYNTDEEYVKQH